MFRISKLADYATVIMCYLARHNSEDDQTLSVSQISQGVHLTETTVSKILKQLARANLVKAHRGVYGGYTLAGQPNMITLAQVITAIEGQPPLITECGNGDAVCTHDQVCAIKSNWKFIGRTFFAILNQITLEAMNSSLLSKTLTSMNFAINSSTQNEVAHG